MSHVPEYQQNLSLRLSEVLDDIGVNETFVLKRRRAILLHETMSTITYRPTLNLSLCVFGGTSEGTSTIGLNSDVDTLHYHLHANVMQVYADWKHGFNNLLMVQDNTTSPGYCFLQQIRYDVPLPITHVPNKYFVRDAYGRVLLKNTLFRSDIPASFVQHGPSWTRQGIPGTADRDSVSAFPCNSWPYEARAWLDRQGIGRWPTADMKRFAENNGCFVVPVGSKVSKNPELEWRISTSIAERCLMFNLNITQIRCYVLMKMIVKTFLCHPSESVISSFMCKTVLLHCIENTPSNAWQENNLFTCLSRCLNVLYNCLQQENCPHFIIPGNNLMAGQFTPEVKAILLEEMLLFIQSDGQALLGVQIDDLGKRLQIKHNMFYQSVENIQSEKEKYCSISALLRYTSSKIIRCHKRILFETIQNSHVSTRQHLQMVLAYYTRCYREGRQLEKKAISLLASFVCSTLGSVIACLNIQQSNTLSQEALSWLNASLNADVCSNRLKLASVFYSVGNMVNTESILRDTERRYAFRMVEPVCDCYNYGPPTARKMFRKAAYDQNEDAVRNVCAFCIRFIPAEIQCVPHELKYEMYRSTPEDMQHRNEYNEYWMDWAIVDSLPFLYFLQYKTYGHLQKFDDQHQALTNLVRTTKTERNLGHRETALNLQGQCMEQENHPNKALLCYMKSLKFRERNNVANIHICRLLARLLRERHEITQQEKCIHIS